MRILTFLREASSVDYVKIGQMAVLSGLANGVLLGLINHAAETVSTSALQTKQLALYLIAYVLFLYTLRYSLGQASLAIQEAICGVRIRITDKLRWVELPFIESTGRGDLMTRLNQDSNLMSQAVPQLTGAAQSAILIVVSLAYLAYVSFISFAFTVGFISIAVKRHLRQVEKARAGLRQARQKEADFYDARSHLLDGFKEVKINRNKNDDLFARIETTSIEAKEIKIEVGAEEVKTWSFARTSFYALLPILVFLVPQYYAEQTTDIYKVTATILFIIGPINFAANSLPLFSRVNMTLENMQSVEDEIDAASHRRDMDPSGAWTDFSEIRMEQTVFSYAGQSGDEFTVGPIDLTIPKGELLFIVGGNGSGKSTLLKLLLGLYYPKSGQVCCDDKVLTEDNYPNYRELFSIIFTDFHLFDRLYGLSSVDPDLVQYWLDKMQLQDKTELENGRFTKLDLSTGQKKRLAFVAAMLEDKPVLIFDELAADQDPQFRQYFYDTILIELKERGKTVIAVTHDDKYFHVADRILKMDSGVFV